MRSFTGLLGTILSQPKNLVPGLAPGAAVKAQKCFFPVSTWVHAFILTCDDKLAVWFKRRVRHRRRRAFGGVPGACCLYPTSNVLLYDLACTWPGAGEFVWRFLYRKMPYQLVAPPKSPCGSDCPGGVQVPCCFATALPQTLHVTFTGALTGTFALAWNGSYWNNAAAVLCSGLRSQLSLTCGAGPTWNLGIGAVDSGACSAATAPPTGTPTCRPLSVVFNITGAGGCCAGQSFTATVTT